MSIGYYDGVPGAAIEIENKSDLIEAIDILHSQVIDNISDTSPYLRVLERAMEDIDGLAE